MIQVSSKIASTIGTLFLVISFVSLATPTYIIASIIKRIWK